MGPGMAAASSRRSWSASARRYTCPGHPAWPRTRRPGIYVPFRAAAGDHRYPWHGGIPHRPGAAGTARVGSSCPRRPRTDLGARPRHQPAGLAATRAGRTRTDRGHRQGTPGRRRPHHHAELHRYPAGLRRLPAGGRGSTRQRRHRWYPPKARSSHRGLGMQATVAVRHRSACRSSSSVTARSGSTAGSLATVELDADALTAACCVRWMRSTTTSSPNLANIRIVLGQALRPIGVVASDVDVGTT